MCWTCADAKLRDILHHMNSTLGAGCEITYNQLNSHMGLHRKAQQKKEEVQTQELQSRQAAPRPGVMYAMPFAFGVAGMFVPGFALPFYSM